MKRVLIVLGLLAAVLVIGLIIFVATFDIDRYRPRLVSELEKALGRPVALERISLGWKGGIAVRLDGLVIHADPSGSGEPLAHIPSAAALAELAPLLRKEVRISSIVLSQPRIHVERDAQGRVNLTGLAIAGSPAAASSPPPPGSGGGAPVAVDIAALQVEDGTLHWTDAMSQPPADIWLRSLDVTVRNIAPGRPMDVELRGALGGTEQNVRLAGRMTLPGQAQAGAVEQARVSVEALPLEAVLPPARANEPSLRGKLTASIEGEAPTLDPATLAYAASGRGTLRLDEAAIKNLNLLREVFARVSILPGLVEMLEARLPPEYREKLAAQDTAFAPIDLSAALADGSLQFDDLKVRTDAFGVTGAGRVGLDRAIDIRSMLQVEPALSEAMIKSVEELRYLTSPEGEIEIPVTIHGQAPNVSVTPDVSYVASKVVKTKAQDLIGDLLGEVLKQ
jgi:hypothetical protein